MVKIDDIVEFKVTVLTRVLKLKGKVFKCRENDVDIRTIEDGKNKQKVTYLNVPKENLEVLKN